MTGGYQRGILHLFHRHDPGRAPLEILDSHPVRAKLRALPSWKHPLLLVAYDRGHFQGQRRADHWAFLIAQDLSWSHDMGVIFQLRGKPGAFHYDDKERDMDLTKSGTEKIMLSIGEVRAGEATSDRIHKALTNVQIVQNEDSKWNCQDWAASCLEPLRSVEGVELWDGVSKEAIEKLVDEHWKRT
ncbi:MAG: hypothetical protein Q9162_005722 [Coniocarpon cinnabarinum]